MKEPERHKAYCIGGHPVMPAWKTYIVNHNGVDYYAILQQDEYAEAVSFSLRKSFSKKPTNEALEYLLGLFLEDGETVTRKDREDSPVAVFYSEGVRRDD